MKLSKRLSAMVLALMTLPAAPAFSAPAACTVSLTQEPLVMRVGKDEFRIAFGVEGASCNDTGCAGSIKYKATWQTEQGTQVVDRKTLDFSIPSGAKRSISVDRHYFDTSEAGHTTQVVHVDVDGISCNQHAVTGLAQR
jgi:hypothetical protein